MIIGDFRVSYKCDTQTKSIFEWKGFNMKLKIEYKGRYFTDYLDASDRYDLLFNLDDVDDDAEVIGYFPDFLVVELTASRFKTERDIYQLIDKYLEVIRLFLERRDL